MGFGREFFFEIDARLRNLGLSPRHIPQLLYIICDPDGIRTHDRLLRRQMLYPAELPDQTAEKTRCVSFDSANLVFFGRFTKFF